MSKEVIGSRDGSFDYTLKEEGLSQDSDQMKRKSIIFTPQDLEEMRRAFLFEYFTGSDVLTKVCFTP